jgi:hypothetical protein
MAMVMVALMAGAAFADSVHIGNTTNNTTNNQGGQGGNASASASATGGTHVQTNTQLNTQVNTQGQSQNQGQQQGQAQGQKQQANNEGNKQSVNVDAPMIPGVAVAPGLTSGGTQVCLGSFSVGLSGPMAGVAFGKTVVDKGCEDRQNAILLFNMGYKAEALELLKGGNERVRVLFSAPVTKASIASIPDVQLITVLGSEVNNVEGGN